MLLAGFQERFLREYAIEMMEKEDSFAVVQLLQHVNNLLSSYEMTADTAFASNSFIEKIPQNSSSFLEAYNTYVDEFRPFVDWIVAARDISRVTVYTSLSQYPFADIRPIDETVRQEKWYKESANGLNKLNKTWAVGEGNLSHIRFFRLIYRYYEPTTNGELIIHFDLDERLLLNLISERDKAHRYIISLANQDIIIDSSDSGRHGKPLASYGEDFVAMLKSVEAGATPDSKIVGGKDHRYLLTAASISDRKSVNGLTLYSLSSLEELNRKVNNIRVQTFGLFFAVLLLSALLIYGFSSGITKRFYLLLKRMRSFDMSHLKQTVEIKGNDELAQLGKVFNDMTVRIEALLSEVVETKLASKEYEIKAKESELYALQTQINPHYLFNTLNAICGNALENGDRETARIVQLLASSFRNVLQKSGNGIALEEELDIVRTYLDIQAFRFGGRVHYEIDIPSSCFRYELPRLSLQTLVENAIIHGVEKTDKQVHIIIWCEKIDEERCALHVTDDGYGMSNERRLEIEAWLNSEVVPHENARIGLLNIHQRLRYMYGAGYGVKISHITDTETTVSMILPAQP